MISRVTQEGRDAFLDFCKRDVYGLRIASYASAYGLTYDFAQFWVQTRQGEVTAALSKLDCDMAMTLTAQADREELNAFCDAVGFASLFCEEGAQRGLKTDEAQYGWVLEQIGDLPVRADVPQALVEEHPDLTGVYHVLNGSGSDWVAVKHYESWYADVSHRMRHGAADALLLRAEDGNPAAVVMLTAVQPQAVIMGGVATLPEYRRRGYSSLLIARFVHRLRLEGKRIFLLREDGKNELFYHALGFVERTRWCVAQRKESHERAFSIK